MVEISDTALDDEVFEDAVCAKLGEMNWRSFTSPEDVMSTYNAVLKYQLDPMVTTVCR